MRGKYFLILLCVALVMAGCATTPPAGNTGQGMLVIGVVLHGMNGAGQPDADQYPVSAMSVKNLNTGQTFNIQLSSNHGLASLPAGIYCVNSITPTKGARLVYCAQPFFNVNAGKILVAGYIEFAINLPSQTYKLVGSFANPQGLFDSLSPSDKNTLANFSNGGAPAAG